MVSDNIISCVSNIEVRAWSLPIILPYFYYHMAFKIISLFLLQYVGTRERHVFYYYSFRIICKVFLCVGGCIVWVWGWVCACVCLFVLFVCLVSFCSLHDAKHIDDVLQVFTLCLEWFSNAYSFSALDFWTIVCISSTLFEALIHLL